jgi:hypothetical protein
LFNIETFSGKTSMFALARAMLTIVSKLGGGLTVAFYG